MSKAEKRKRLIWDLALLILTGVLLFSGFQALRTLHRERREQDAFNQLAALVSEARVNAPYRRPAAQGSTDPQTEAPAPIEQAGESVTEEGGILPEYAALAEANPDFFGWLTIEGTEVNYPVVYTPEEPEYYLRRAFDGSSSQSGVPFLDGACAPEGSYYLIYGHHMKNGSMFGVLPDYADKSFGESHALIYLDTRTERRTYQLVAAFFSEIYPKDATGVFRYYEYTDLSREADFDTFLAGVHASALYDMGVEVHWGDELLTLSTCNYHTDDGRFVVVAKRIN